LFDAFSLREPVSTSLENALISALHQNKKPGRNGRAFFLCAEHDRQLGGESLLSSLMAAKD
jgi:hypothetical protein